MKKIILGCILSLFYFSNSHALFGGEYYFPGTDVAFSFSGGLLKIYEDGLLVSSISGNHPDLRNFTFHSSHNFTSSVSYAPSYGLSQVFDGEVRVVYDDRANKPANLFFNTSNGQYCPQNNPSNIYTCRKFDNTGYLGSGFASIFNESYNFSIEENFVINGEVYLMTDLSIGLNQEVPKPTLLTQSYIAPFTNEWQEILLGNSIGKFQSGSGVIFGAKLDADISIGTFLEVNVLDMSFNNIASGTGSFETDGKASVTLGLSEGEYIWNARTVDEAGNESEVVLFSPDTPNQARFKIFEGFEPYPYGYNFPNASPDFSLLTGGFLIENSTLVIEEGSKWDIMDTIFPLSAFNDNYKMYLNAFEVLGLNELEPSKFSRGNCFGLALTAMTQYFNPDYTSIKFPEFSDEIGNNYVWDTIDVTYDDDRNKWEGYDDSIRTILANQMYQNESTYIELQKYSYDTTTPVDILNQIKDNPDETHMMVFKGKDDCLVFGLLCTDAIAHAVVPYKVEDNRIYIWDNNTPYPFFNIDDDTFFAYDQYIEVDMLDNTFIFEKYGDWDVFEDIAIVNIEDILATQNTGLPAGFSDGELLYTFSGLSDFIITDNDGNNTGFQNGNIIEEIPGSQVLVGLNATGDDSQRQDSWKQIYFPNGKDNLSVEIDGKIEESYTLMVAGGNYYAKVESVEITEGETDIIDIAFGKIELDFDESKQGNYNILMDNFDIVEAQTVLMSEIESSVLTQRISVDWANVVENTDDAVNYETDLDNDGNFDTIMSVPAISTGEELIPDVIPEPQVSTYIYPSNTISWNSGQQRSVSSYYSIVPNFDEYNWGEDIVFTTSGEGNPTVNTTNNGRQLSGVLRSGANIQIDVPPVGDSYTAYLHIGEYTLEYTVSRDSAPEANVGTLDFGTKIVNYGGTATSNWVSFPFLSEDTQFTLTGDGNPTAQTVTGQRSDSGFVRWGTNIKAEIPGPGETRTIDFEILGQTGTFTIIRQ